MDETSLKQLICDKFLDGDRDYPLESDTRLVDEGICDSLGLVQLAGAIEKRLPGLRIQDQDGKLVFKSEESFRSSSGSRATYARLYGGLACRDGTEMAYRYNFYGRSSESGACARPTFPGKDSALEW